MGELPISANEILIRPGLKSKLGLKKNYIDPALKEHLIEMTIADKSTSKNQKYVKSTDSPFHRIK